MNTPKTHPLNVSYLVVGLVFLGIAGSWALRTAGLVNSEAIHWLLPAILVVAGAVGLVAFAVKGLRRDADPTHEAEDPAYDQLDYYDPFETSLEHPTTETSHTRDGETR